MKLKFSLLTVIAFAVTAAITPKADAVLAAYVHVVKNDLADTRFHLGEIEAFSGGAVPNGLGGATFGGLPTSTNDLGPGLVAFGLGNLYPVLGTTTALEHGGGATNPNNILESAGAVWSTADGIGSNAQYTLDLGGTFDVTTIRLWPRADACCATRWQNLEIQLLDSNRNPIAGTLNVFAGDGVNNTPLEYNFPAVPEPGALALVGLAGSVVLLRRRRA